MLQFTLNVKKLKLKNGYVYLSSRALVGALLSGLDSAPSR
jgi:hypothetical protein